MVGQGVQRGLARELKGRWLRNAATCLLCAWLVAPWVEPVAAQAEVGSGAAVTEGAADSVPVSAGRTLDDLIKDILSRRIQDERVKLGLEPLIREPSVEAAAQTFADDVGQTGSWLGVDLSAERASALLEERGYIHFKLTTTYFAGGIGDPEIWVDSWISRARSTFDRFHNPDFKHFGIGSAHLEDLSFYYLMVATSQVAYYREATLQLQDLKQVREQVRELVNEERRKLRLRPLMGHPVLDRVAQNYAQDMFERGFYGHTSPEGESVRDRVVRIGYKPARVAENLGSGQTTVEQVMEGWMASPGHRANILHRRLREIGTGVAIGEKNGEFKILWVQVFSGRR